MSTVKRKSKYPWTIWTNGQEHRIVRGRDYTISTYNMQVSLHGRAKRDGLRVVTLTFEVRRPDDSGLMEKQEGLKFQFFSVT